MALGKVYCFRAPTFRAEKVQDPPPTITEFWMVESRRWPTWTPGRGHGPRRADGQLSWVQALPGEARARVGPPSWSARRPPSSRNVAGAPFPRHHLTPRPIETLQEGRPPPPSGGRLRRGRGDGARQPVRPAGDRPTATRSRPEGLLTSSNDPENTPRWRWAWTCLAPEGYGRESSAAARARTISRGAGAAPSRSNHLPPGRGRSPWYLDLRKYGQRPPRRLRAWGVERHRGVGVRPPPTSARPSPNARMIGAHHPISALRRFIGVRLLYKIANAGPSTVHLRRTTILEGRAKAVFVGGGRGRDDREDRPAAGISESVLFPTALQDQGSALQWR